MKPQSAWDQLRESGAVLTYRQFDHWTRRGFIEMEEPTPGHGNHRTVSPAELRRVKLMAALVADGMTAPEASRVATEIAENGRARLGGLLLTAQRGRLRRWRFPWEARA